MGCERWQSSLVARLYGESEPSEERLLAEHLDACESCRRELDELRRARELLREADPDVPAMPRVLVLGSGTRSRALPFAAGFAAALLLAAGMAGGWWLAGGGRAPADLTASGSPPPVEVIVPEAFPVPYTARLDAFERRLDDQDRRLDAVAASGGAPLLSRREFDTGLDRFGRAVDRKRTAQLEYVLGEIARVEQQTRVQIGQTNEALRYVVLASDPSLDAR